MNHFKKILGMITLCTFCIILPMDQTDNQNQEQTQQSLNDASISPPVTAVQDTNPMGREAIRAMYAHLVAAAQKSAIENKENKRVNNNQ